MTRKLQSRAFTLAEVMIALAIAATALLLILQANNFSMRKCAQSCRRETLIRAAESKLDEIAAGLEPAASGEFESLPGYAWHAIRRIHAVDELDGIEQVRLEVSEPESGAITSLSVFVFVSRKARP